MKTSRSSLSSISSYLLEQSCSRWLLIMLFALLSGCGGGGSGDGSSSNAGDPLIISWAAPSTLGTDGNALVVTSFMVYRGTTANNLTLLSSVSVSNNPPLLDETLYTDSTVTSGDPFYYAISAVTANGAEGPLSATINTVAP